VNAFTIAEELETFALGRTKTKTIPKHVLDSAERRWKQYLRDAEEE
jgi:hypothetical protein